MTMMGGPIDARRSPTAVNNLATQRSYEWFENNVIYRVPGNFPGAGRRVYPGFMQHTGFVAMNPDRHATSHYDYFQDLIKGDNSSAEAHRQFYDEYNAVLDMDADYYLETINTVFQEFKLVNGTWDVKAPNGNLERVKPADIRSTALMTVEGELDDISGSGQTRAAQDMCSGISADIKTHLEVQGAGHYGIFSGRRWRDTVYPTVRAFIASHGGGVLRDPQALAPAAIVDALLERRPAAADMATTLEKADEVQRTARLTSAPAKPSGAPVATATARATARAPEPAPATAPAKQVAKVAKAAPAKKSPAPANQATPEARAKKAGPNKAAAEPIAVSPAPKTVMAPLAAPVGSSAQPAAPAKANSPSAASATAPAAPTTPATPTPTAAEANVITTSPASKPVKGSATR
jgi:poly(3-hydroxybutyrate) depolymerase